jgi:hypothetical protein
MPGGREAMMAFDERINRMLKRFTIKKFIWLAAMLAALSISAYSQSAAGTPAITDDVQELKTQEQIVDELRFRRMQVNALQAQVAAMSDQIKTFEALTTALRERGDLFKEAAENRGRAGLLEAERDRERREQLEEYSAEVVRLRTENDKLRRSRDIRMVIGVAAGVAAGAGIRK